MLLALLENGAIKRYPVSLEDIRRANPQISLPSEIDSLDFASLGVAVIHPTDRPVIDRSVNRLEEATPVFTDTGWYQAWSVIELTEDERAHLKAIKEASVRNERNTRLRASDWTQLADAPVDTSGWATYRQLLRDVPQQEGFPWDITWPSEPNLDTAQS